MYTKAALSNNIVDNLLSLWSTTLVPHDDSAPILDHDDLHSTIDSIKLRHVPWESYTTQYNGLRPDNAHTPEWMTTKYQLWYRNPRRVIRKILTNPELADHIDYVPYHDFEDGKRRYCDFMSGDWAWRQCVREFYGPCLRLLIRL